MAEEVEYFVTSFHLFTFCWFVFILNRKKNVMENVTEILGGRALTIPATSRWYLRRTKTTKIMQTQVGKSGIKRTYYFICCSVLKDRPRFSDVLINMKYCDALLLSLRGEKSEMQT